MMFKQIIDIDKTIFLRIADKIIEKELPIETEIGLVRNGIVRVLFIYEDYSLLNKIITESTNEEYDIL